MPLTALGESRALPRHVLGNTRAAKSAERALPVVPASVAAGPGHEANEPEDEDDGRCNPQDLHRKAHAEENGGEQ